MINNLSDEPDTAKSPWAKWKDSYVVVTFETGGDFEFHWVSADEAGWRIDLEKETGLTKGDVYHSATNKDINFRMPNSLKNPPDESLETVKVVSKKLKHSRTLKFRGFV